MKDVEHGFTLLEDELMQVNLEWKLEDERIYEGQNFKSGQSPLNEAVLKISQTLQSAIGKMETRLVKGQGHRIHKTRLNDW